MSHTRTKPDLCLCRPVPRCCSPTFARYSPPPRPLSQAQPHKRQRQWDINMHKGDPPIARFSTARRPLSRGASRGLSISTRLIPRVDSSPKLHNTPPAAQSWTSDTRQQALVQSDPKPLDAEHASVQTSENLSLLTPPTADTQGDSSSCTSGGPASKQVASVDLRALFGFWLLSLLSLLRPLLLLLLLRQFSRLRLPVGRHPRSSHRYLKR